MFEDAVKHDKYTDKWKSFSFTFGLVRPPPPYCIVYYLCKFYFPGCGAQGAPQENIVAYKVLKVTDIYTNIYKGFEFASRSRSTEPA